MANPLTHCAWRHAGPRPTLPPGGRIGYPLVPSQWHARDAASHRSTDRCAHPGSGAALTAGMTR
ncbi:hypothetical protein SAMN05443551_1665 [Marivita hallyeonensis]|uniref:Uncharacterized protein n=1 Tax=Marivita hallyeonensis TaxID=996342 RepID=A0A1M5R8R6_9RHOB|nr:hypothetical protein SAMN05443551_1665 [Marivita hallyeonensis]